MVHYLKSYVAYFGISSPCAVSVVICFVMGMMLSSLLSPVEGMRSQCNWKALFKETANNSVSKCLHVDTKLKCIY